MKIVSACLAGINCRWNGENKICHKVLEMVKRGEALPVCPELLAGFSTPRQPAEQKGDRVFTKDGQDVTVQFKKGATMVLKIAKAIDCQEAIMKSCSPSCGCGKIYDGTFSGKLIVGDGVVTKILKENNIKIITEEDL